MIAGKREFGKLMEYNMKTYSDEVNEQRAIPSIRDGLKPIQRKILYWLFVNKGVKDYRGCAEVSGGVTGAYHPHSDEATYLAAARLSQPLIMNYPLIDFHGNNGSLTDPPAAKRYTKCRLSEFGKSLLINIDIPGAVEYKDNYNETLKEPCYLLGTLGPLNLLCNPQIGIGVGLACNFLPHHIEDVKNIVQYRMQHPTCRFEDLPEIYPYFKNNGIIINKSEVRSIYRSGKGTVVVRGKYHWDGNILYITEFPYRVDSVTYRKNLLEHPIDGISEVYEQNGQLKIYIEPTANKEAIENILLKKTPLQNSYSVNMTATDMNGKPRLFGLLDIIDTYIELQHHRITKVAEYNKAQWSHKLLIDEGIAAALQDVDKVIAIIRAAESQREAEDKLITALGINNEQAKAILDIRLGRLSRMDIQQVNDEIQNLKRGVEAQDRIITQKVVREEILTNDLSTYADTSSRTECYDYITVGADGDKINQEAQLAITAESYACKYLENGEAEQQKILPDGEYNIVTNAARIFCVKGDDFKVGEHSWTELISALGKNEYPIFVFDKNKKTKGEFCLFTDIETNQQYYIHISFLNAGSKRGKRISSKKNINLRFDEILTSAPSLPQLR